MKYLENKEFGYGSSLLEKYANKTYLQNKNKCLVCGKRVKVKPGKPSYYCNNGCQYACDKCERKIKEGKITPSDLRYYVSRGL